MKRLRGSVPTAVALLTVAVFAASGADAKPRHRHHHGYVEPVARRPVEFPTYVDHGSDRNPGMDNLYFTDTKNPTYELGPTIFQKYEFK